MCRDLLLPYIDFDPFSVYAGGFKVPVGNTLAVRYGYANSIKIVSNSKLQHQYKSFHSNIRREQAHALRVFEASAHIEPASNPIYGNAQNLPHNKKAVPGWVRLFIFREANLT